MRSRFPATPFVAATALGVLAVAAAAGPARASCNVIPAARTGFAVGDSTWGVVKVNRAFARPGDSITLRPIQGCATPIGFADGKSYVARVSVGYGAKKVVVGEPTVTISGGVLQFPLPSPTPDGSGSTPSVAGPLQIDLAVTSGSPALVTFGALSKLDPSCKPLGDVLPRSLAYLPEWNDLATSSGDLLATLDSDGSLLVPLVHPLPAQSPPAGYGAYERGGGKQGHGNALKGALTYPDRVRTFTEEGYLLPRVVVPNAEGLVVGTAEFGSRSVLRVARRQKDDEMSAEIYDFPDKDIGANCSGGTPPPACAQPIQVKANERKTKTCGQVDFATLAADFAGPGDARSPVIADVSSAGTLRIGDLHHKDADSCMQDMGVKVATDSAGRAALVARGPVAAVLTTDTSPPVAQAWWVKQNSKVLPVTTPTPGAGASLEAVVNDRALAVQVPAQMPIAPVLAFRSAASGGTTSKAQVLAIDGPGSAKATHLAKAEVPAARLVGSGDTLILLAPTPSPAQIFHRGTNTVASFGAPAVNAGLSESTAGLVRPDGTLLAFDISGSTPVPLPTPTGTLGVKVSAGEPLFVRDRRIVGIDAGGKVFLYDGTSHTVTTPGSTSGARDLAGGADIFPFRLNVTGTGTGTGDLWVLDTKPSPATVTLVAGGVKRAGALNISWMDPFLVSRRTVFYVAACPPEQGANNDCLYSYAVDHPGGTEPVTLARLTNRAAGGAPPAAGDRASAPVLDLSRGLQIAGDRPYPRDRLVPLPAEDPSAGTILRLSDGSGDIGGVGLVAATGDDEAPSAHTGETRRSSTKNAARSARPHKPASR